MALVAGLDPGVGGAIAVYDTVSRDLSYIVDLPFWYEAVGAKKRKRLDKVALQELCDTLSVMGVELIVMEAVGGRPGQSASAGYSFGFAVGLIYSSLFHAKIIIESVPPTRWKKLMNVPGKAGGKGKSEKQQAHGSIMLRVEQMFPNHRDAFRTPRGKFLMDRADAAMLAKYAGDHIWATMPVGGDIEAKLGARKGQITW